MINTHNKIVDFGRHKGLRYTRLPVSYLRWMVNSEHSRKEIAKSELQRRGTTLPDLEISGHAIDRASRIMLHQWQSETRESKEGFHSWLYIKAYAAWTSQSNGVNEEIEFEGIRYAFEPGEQWPVLKTVIPLKGRRK